MNLKNVEKKEKNTVVLTIEVGAEEFDAAVNKVYRRAKGSMSVPGFRKGKAPRKLIEKMYGETIFYEDAINDVYPQALEDAIKEADLEVVGYPQLNIEHVGADGFQFTATVGVKPEVKLGQYKGVASAKDTVVVTDQDVEDEMKPLISRATTQETVDRPVENGDTTIIDFEGFVDGVAFEGGKAEQYSLKIGSGSFIPGFEEQIIGMSAGDEKDINVTFPAEYGAEELAGKPAVFKVKLHEVKADDVPEIDDEFAKDVSEFETLDELKADLRAKVEKRKADNAQQAFEAAVMNQVIEAAEMEIPDTMVEYELDKQMQNMESRVSGMGVTLEQYLSMMGSNMTEFRENMRPSALRGIQQDLVLEAVVAAEGFEATEEEKQAEVEKLAKEYDMEEDKIRAAITDDQLAYSVKMDKATKLIYGSAVVTELTDEVEVTEQAAPAEETAAEEATAAETASEEPAEE
ncbi:MAG: trigger factor [Clostridiales bacterium]|nr:trigger factor [Clostridiales bacterium]